MRLIGVSATTLGKVVSGMLLRPDVADRIEARLGELEQGKGAA